MEAEKRRPPPKTNFESLRKRFEVLSKQKPPMATHYTHLTMQYVRLSRNGKYCMNYDARHSAWRKSNIAVNSLEFMLKV